MLWLETAVRYNRPCTMRWIASHALCYRSFPLIGMLTDGCVSDPAVAGRLTDDLLAAQKAHLPQFA